MDTSKPEMSQIAQFYAGKNVLVTGATGKKLEIFKKKRNLFVAFAIQISFSQGFMGKVLVEKLLRDCGDVSRIYILVRTKKGASPVQRHTEYVKHLIFEKIRAGNFEKLSKIKVIKGDLSCDRLGLEESDENELIDNVNVIFHVAANVRFDLSLRDAIGFNTVGTYRVLQLAERMKNLQVFTHVSTAYCHCNEEIVEEKYYPAIENPYGVMEMVKLLNDDILADITPKLLQGLPNTYALTKSLTEDLVHSYRDKFPIAICRPSIVTAAWKEPYEGWVEGQNGPTGIKNVH
jgi:fatty acyl-CoA reductase